MKAKNDGDDNSRRNKALFKAAHNGDIDGAKYAIERGADELCGAVEIAGERTDEFRDCF